jgi:hypothetical protein
LTISTTIRGLPLSHSANHLGDSLSQSGAVREQVWLGSKVYHGCVPVYQRLEP